MNVDSASEPIERGDAVALTGDRTVKAVDTDGEAWHGLATDAADEKPDGTLYVGVMLKGARNGNVTQEYDADNDSTTADVAVEAPASLVPNGVKGQLRPLRDGESANHGIDGLLMASPDADSHGLVFLR
jgi:hypothetical protein